MKRIFTSLAIALMAITGVAAQQVAFFYHDQQLADNATITVTEAVTTTPDPMFPEIPVRVEMVTDGNGALQLRNLTSNTVPVWGRLTANLPNGGSASMCSTNCFPEGILDDGSSATDLDPQGSSFEDEYMGTVYTDRLGALSFHLFLPMSMSQSPYSTTFKMNYYNQVQGAPGTEIAKLNILYNYLPSNLNGLEQIGLESVKLLQMNGNCTLQYASNGKNLKLEVFNLLGSKVVSMPLPAGSSSVNIPTRLQNGVHIFRITSNGKAAFVQKFIIK